jgi:hypothetical protein
LYPFREPVMRVEQHPTAPLLWHRVPTGEPPRLVSVRLAPDIANYSWGNEYVSLEPFDDIVLLRTRLFAGRDGVKVMTRSIGIELNPGHRADHAARGLPRRPGRTGHHQVPAGTGPAARRPRRT